MFLLWHLSLTAINLSYTFPILETSATALCGTTGIYPCLDSNSQTLQNVVLSRTSIFRIQKTRIAASLPFPIVHNRRCPSSVLGFELSSLRYEDGATIFESLNKSGEALDVSSYSLAMMLGSTQKFGRFLLDVLTWICWASRWTKGGGLFLCYSVLWKFYLYSWDILHICLRYV